MARNTRANHYEGVTQPVIAIGNEFPAGHHHPPHRHRRSQLLYAEFGTMNVETEDGGWVVPPNEGVWIPSGVIHSIRMQTDVATRSVYFDGRTSQEFPGHCQVIGVSPLLRHLLIEAADLPIDYEPESRAGRIMALIVDEVRLAPVLPLYVPIPKHPRLAEMCMAYAKAPSVSETIDDWSTALALSRRSFTRLFRRETGLSFAAWQRRVCLQTALPRLMEGALVTDIAFDLGYSSAASFTVMFTELVGMSPQAYLRQMQ